MERIQAIITYTFTLVRINMITIVYVGFETPPTKTKFSSRKELISYFTRKGYQAVRTDINYAWQTGIGKYYAAEAAFSSAGHAVKNRLAFSCCPDCLNNRLKYLKQYDIQPNNVESQCPPCDKENII